MSYLMMEITNWDRGLICSEPSTSEVCRQFNLAAEDLDEDFGVIRMGAETKSYVVMASVEAAKKMLHALAMMQSPNPYIRLNYSIFDSHPSRSPMLPDRPHLQEVRQNIWIREKGASIPFGFLPLANNAPLIPR